LKPHLPGASSEKKSFSVNILTNGEAIKFYITTECTNGGGYAYSPNKPRSWQAIYRRGVEWQTRKRIHREIMMFRDQEQEHDHDSDLHSVELKPSWRSGSGGGSNKCCTLWAKGGIRNHRSDPCRLNDKRETRDKPFYLTLSVRFGS